MAGFTDFIATDASDTANAVPDVLDRNWQTTAAIGLGVASGGVTAGLMLSAFPAQTLLTTGTISALAYVGHRRHNGETPLPFLNRKSDNVAEVTEPVVTAPVVTDTPAVATA